MRSLRHLLASTLPAVLGLLASGCGMLDAKLQAQTVCYTLPAYPIPGVPVSGTLSTPISFNLGNDLPIVSEKGVSYTLIPKSIEISVDPSSPKVDLGGVTTFDVSAPAPAGSGLADVALIHYVHGAEPHPTSLAAPSLTDQDLAPYVSDGKLELLAEGSGSLPAYDWKADVTGCFLLTVDVNSGEKL